MFRLFSNCYYFILQLLWVPIQTKGDLEWKKHAIDIFGPTLHLLIVDSIYFRNKDWNLPSYNEINFKQIFGWSDYHCQLLKYYHLCVFFSFSVEPLSPLPPWKYNNDAAETSSFLPATTGFSVSFDITIIWYFYVYNISILKKTFVLISDNYFQNYRYKCFRVIWIELRLILQNCEVLKY